MSLAGLTSRRNADQWIKEGKIKVNGHLVIEPGGKAVWGKDRILVDGQEIPPPFARIYLLLNKPFGYISSLNDPQGRPLVTDLLVNFTQRVYPVGRLDFDTLGLLLLTNDGEWSHYLTHPSNKIPRTYKVTISGQITHEAIETLCKGVQLEDGPVYGSRATVVSRNSNQSVIRLTITQGKNRQVRRMLEAVGFTVVHLIRVGFGNLLLGDLKPGEYRYLETVEVEGIKKPTPFT